MPAYQSHSGGGPAGESYALAATALKEDMSATAMQVLAKAFEQRSTDPATHVVVELWRKRRATRKVQNDSQPWEDHPLSRRIGARKG